MENFRHKNTVLLGVQRLWHAFRYMLVENASEVFIDTFGLG